MKQDYTLDELQTEMTALAQLFDSVTLADPRMGLLDPATLQPLNKVAAMPALDAAGRGLKIEKAADGLRTVIAQGITVADTPCVLLLGMPLPRNLQADGAEDAFTRALSQMQDDLRRDYVTGVYNSVYLNEAFRPRAERAALDGKPVGVVMVRVNEYWQLREQESNSAADCCLNMASGISAAGRRPRPRQGCGPPEYGFFAIVTVGTPAARMARAVNEAMNASRREFNISLSRRGSFTVAIASAEWGETASWDMHHALSGTAAPVNRIKTSPLRTYWHSPPNVHKGDFVMQSDNEKMLQEIVQNTEMGKNTLDELMSLTHDQKLKDEMRQEARVPPLQSGCAHCAGRHRGRGPRTERRRPYECQHGNPHPDDDGQIDPQSGYHAGRGQRPGRAGLQARRARLPRGQPRRLQALP